MSFEALAPPARSRLWDPADVDAAEAVLSEHGRVGWNEPYESEGKARGAGSALARLLHERTQDAYRVSVFERGEDAPGGAGFYFSIKPKTAGDDSEKVNPDAHSKSALLDMAVTAGADANDGMTKRQIADAINAAPVAQS